MFLLLLSIQWYVLPIACQLHADHKRHTLFIFTALQKEVVMPSQGTIVRWNQALDFGYIRDDYSSEEIFAHITAFHDKFPLPLEGERVRFNIITNEQRRQEAQNIEYTQRRPLLASQHTSPHYTMNTLNKAYRPAQAPAPNPLTLTIIGLMLALTAYLAYYQYFRQPGIPAAPYASTPLPAPKSGADKITPKPRIIYERKTVTIPNQAQTAPTEITASAQH